MKKYLKMTGLIVLYGGVYYLAQMIVGIISGIVIVAQNFDKAQDISFIEQMIMKNMHMILISSIIISLLIYFLIFAIRRINLINYCHISSIKIKNIVLILILGIGLNILFTIINLLTEFYEFSPEKLEQLSKIIMGNSFFISLLVIGIIVPIFEEILFRGLIFNELRQNVNIWVGIILQAIIFGVYHGNIVQGTYTFILGIVLGLTYIWFNSIWAPIALHVVNNSISVTMAHFLPNEFELSNIALVILIIPSSLLIIVALYFLRKRRVDIINEQEDSILDVSNITI